MLQQILHVKNKKHTLNLNFNLCFSKLCLLSKKFSLLQYTFTIHKLK